MTLTIAWLYDVASSTSQRIANLCICRMLRTRLKCGCKFMRHTEAIWLFHRWINCLLIREVPFNLAARLWDTYLAEGGRLKSFLIYIAAAFLLSWSEDLRRMDFQVGMQTENLP